MDYTDFSVEDLASDERFINWVKNDCPQAERDFWRLLALSHPHLQERIDRARILVINVYRADHAEETMDPIDDETVHEIWQNVLVGIEDADHATGKTITLLPTEPQKTFFSQKRRRALAFAVAASVTLLLSTIFLLQKEATPPVEWYSYRQESPGFVEFSNTTQKPMQLVTMDGSSISLEPNSRIKYKRNYESDTIRKVYLQGEAFFDVARNPQKPFVVFTNDVATEVLGTSFRVTGDAVTKNVVVKVKTGKVSVYSVKKQSVTLNDPKEGVILLPNQEVIYTDEMGMFEKKIVDAPELVKSPSTYSFIFEDAPIASVFEKLEEAYGVEILFDRETMKNCFLTVPLGSEPLFDKLKVICRTIGASYEIIDAKVVIASAGCKTVDSNNTKK
jgi:ferric-dicitrate binding protein FerR (iron transport regulator)